MTPTVNLEAGAGDLVERLEIEATWFSRVYGDPNAVSPLLREAAAQLAAVTAENARLREALEKAQNDTARLDYLDSLNASLNARYGTKYRWSMVVNQNVNRVMFNFPLGADLSDYNPHGFGSCRGAIDQRMAETAAYRRAALSQEAPK